MKNSSSFATGVIKVKETELLDSGRFRALGELAWPEFLNFLKESKYSAYLKNEPADFDDTTALKDHWLFMKKLPARPEFLNFLLAKNDFFNAKLLLKANLARYKIPFNFSDYLAAPGFMDIEKLKELIFESRASRQPGFLEKAIIRIMKNKEIEKKPVEIDYLLDREYFSYLLELAAQLGSNFLGELGALWIDLYNLRAFFRIKAFTHQKIFLEKFLAPGGRQSPDKLEKLFHEDWESFVLFLKNSGGFSALSEGVSYFLKEKDTGQLEKIILDLEMGQIKKAKFFTFGVEPLVGYSLAKEREIKNLKIIFTAKKNGLAPAKITNLLGEAYV